MHASRSMFHIGTVLMATVCLALPTRRADAQGALSATRSAPAASPTTAGEESFAPARSVLHRLVGRWRFAIWFAGNFDGAPDVSGTRMVEALYDDLRVQWTEQFDNSLTRSQGIIGFDRRNGRFFSSAVHSDGSGMEFLTGTMSAGEPLITFSRSTAESFTLTMIDADHFTWVPLDRSWRAVFTREPAPSL